MRWRLPALLAICLPANADSVVAGSKSFTESYILAEIAAQLLEHNGIEVERRLGLNGTKIAFTALANDAIDFYPEYSGTISEVILADPELRDWSAIEAAISKRGYKLLPPLGFNNTYALAVTREAANRHGLRTISDLRHARELRIALSHEFLNRQDGWPGLTARYELVQSVSGIEHSLAYEAMENGQLDGTDVYSTDGEISRSDLVILEDDLDYFPVYRAAFFCAPRPGAGGRRRLEDLERPHRQKLTLTALAMAIAVGVGIAVTVHRHQAAAGAFLYVTGLVQTIPSIALLALLIPLVGVGQTPAIIALFLYSLLPIARSTITALHAIPPLYRQMAAAMAMTRRQELRYALMPLAMPHVLAGIRTATIISIGTATLAAFIGAGGLGDPIVTGLALNDTSLILQGAIPAAGLAILTELLFGGVERWLVVPHMRSGHRAS